MRNQKGFTLIELIVVIAIIAILAAVAIPSYLGMQARAQKGVDIANATAIVSAINFHNAMQTESTEKIVNISASSSAEDITNAETTLGNLFPNGITGDAKARAWKRVKVDANGIAEVDNDTSGD